MSKETNSFGGKNPHGSYVPMSEDEQEVIARLVESKDYEVIIHGWATLHAPKMIFGDLRVAIPFRLTFSGIPFPRPLYYLDLELRTKKDCLTLVRQRQPLISGGQPLQIAEGVSVELVWDIAIHHMDPKIVKILKPGATGLTSRRQDKDTGDMTAQGNMKLNERQKRLLHTIETGFAQVRAEDARILDEVVKKASKR